MGPRSGDLIHFSYVRRGLFRVLIDSTSAGIQGGVSLLPATCSAPVMKGAVSPVDGQLYITGFTLWGTNANRLSAFTRLRYTGQPFHLSEVVGGIKEVNVLLFGDKIDPLSALVLSATSG